MQALILAAGKGSRLGSLTKNKPKCMLDVAGELIIDRTIDSLINNNINRIIIVIGYLGHIIKKYLTKKYPNIELVFIDESKLISEKHNNIYSFLAAKDELVKDDTLVIESDIIFKSEIISGLLNNIIPNQAVISYFKDYMNGSCVALDENNRITTLVNINKYEKTNLYKTVNIYKFSKEFLTDTYIPYCETYMDTFGLDCYYEEPLDNLVKNSNLVGYVVEDKDWFEVDTQEDYDIANMLFADLETKYKNLLEWYGGYHKIPGLVDCCYLTNPFFNIESIIYNIDFSKTIKDYPISADRSVTHLSRFYDLPIDYLVVGNGATELIQALGEYFKNKTAKINGPTFGEYYRFFNFDNTNPDIKIIVNPNNPIGYISKDKLFKQLDEAKEKNQIVVVDESFMDFAPIKYNFSLLDKKILDNYPNLIVLKSLGKSFGLNGLRIGLIATSNTNLINSIKKNIPSWNINAITEEILSRLYLEKDNYKQSLQQFRTEAERMFYAINPSSISDKLDEIDYSGGNFICIHLNNIDIHTFCVDMLNKYNIIFKDLTNKVGKGWIRISINDKNTNDYVLKSIRQYLCSDIQC